MTTCTDLPKGSKYKMRQVSKMVKKDKSLIDDFTEEEVQESLAELEAQRDRYRVGVRANHQAVVKDVAYFLKKMGDNVSLVNCSFVTWY